jgi:hypothetical protein
MAPLAYVRLVRIRFHEHVWKLCPGRATVVIAKTGNMRDGTGIDACVEPERSSIWFPLSKNGGANYCSSIAVTASDPIA